MTLKKKTEDEINEGTKQAHNIFAYICKSIGETLDVYRFDTPEDNDLREAVNKYNFYKNIVDKTNIEEPLKSWFEEDGKMKLLSIDNFAPENNWNIDNFWTNEEKINLGFKEADNVSPLECIHPTTLMPLTKFKII